MKTSEIPSVGTTKRESPDHVRLSLAAAMTLGFTRGWFYRNAKLRCINLLLTYDRGCTANCAFCGLAAEKTQQAVSRGKFIRVPWQTFHLDEVIAAIREAPASVARVCVSMITHPRAKQDVIAVCRRVALETGTPVSLLIAPSILAKDDLKAMKDAGADRIGVAVDAATREIFERLRGKPVQGPHRWDTYWRTFEQSLEIFGEGMAGVHLISGLGETEQELVGAISRVRTLGGTTHLFSFFPEKGSLMERHPQPPVGSYRRIQLARWLIDQDKTRMDAMQFDRMGRIGHFGLSDGEIEAVVSSGSPFETSGCPGRDGKVACNRPYGNEKPGSGIRNFPFPPDAEDVERIKEELYDYSLCQNS